jgi:hypothetical protein
MNSRTIYVRRCKYVLVGILLLLLLRVPALAQGGLPKWGLGLTGGMATFSMSDLKEYQRERINDGIPDAQIVKSFPVYFTGAVHVTYTDGRKFFDVSVGRTSTGGRISYSDYSGKYSHDMTVIMGYTAVSAGLRVANARKIDVFAAGQVLLYSNILKEKASETIYGGSGYKYQHDYVSLNLAIAPSLQLQKRIGSHLMLRQQFSYEFHIASPLLRDGSKEKLTNKSGESIRIQGQGLRINVGIAYMF